MFSLIILLALGWLLYKALFPKVAPYYGENLADADPHLYHENPRHSMGYNYITPDPLREKPEDIFIDPCHLGYLGEDDGGGCHEIGDADLNQNLIRSMDEDRDRHELYRQMMKDSHPPAGDLMSDHASFHYDDFLASNGQVMDKDPCHNPFGDFDW